MQKKIDDHEEKSAAPNGVMLGGGKADKLEKAAQGGKLTARERIDALVDQRQL
jgi:acetyl-CoA carboxylase carboxyltransferase component